jgi:hypothetical protein
MVCIAENLPCVIWGGVGSGKSSALQQISRELEMKLYDLRLSDKEPTDLGGIPFPQEDEEGRKFVRWLVASDLIPFVRPGREDEDCILFMDEYDRCEKATENVSIQLSLDRCVNGHRLVPGCRIVCAGNGSSDNGTSVISDAAATRLVHFYVDTASEGALQSWTDWASRPESNVSPVARGFARFRQELFTGAQPKFTELQRATNRTSTWAFKAAETCDSIPWGEEVVEPIVFGLVGQIAGREILAYRRLFRECPPPEAIAADPAGVALPGEFGIYFALGQQLMAVASHNGTQEEPELTKQYARYVGRWPEEQQAHFFRTGSASLPSIVHTPEYRRWEKGFRI